MLGAYIATHLSIMLENFEVASFLKQYWKSFTFDLLALFRIFFVPALQPRSGRRRVLSFSQSKFPSFKTYSLDNPELYEKNLLDFSIVIHTPVVT